MAESTTPSTGWASTLASILGPTTYIVALLFFFGFSYTDALYEHFGIDAATLGFSTQDYLLRSASALFIPGFVALAVGLLLVLGYYLSGSVARRPPRAQQHPADRGALRAAVRYGSFALIAVGAVLFVLGVLGGFQVWPASELATPMLLGGGLLAAGCGRVFAVRGSGRVYPFRQELVALVLVGALVLLASFWASHVDAKVHGRSDAAYLAHHLWLRPAARVDTTERLYFDSPGVRETVLPANGSAQRFRYRYEGLRLLAQSGNRMFLIPDQWTPASGYVLLATADPNIRVSFHPG
ncbi:hypothetical protein ABIA32_000469 [Streptacidiphilus sp. MAP12-20]|uniref:hypothetical protein n=1 Tax=Streptacidiphilus sp. MAP12-20 TaxID=3156299 RepID=UPI00351985C6